MTTLLIIVTRVGWGILELSLRVRDRARGKGGTHQDRGTRALSSGLFMAAIAVAIALEAVTGTHSPLRILGRPAIAGLALMWLGLALRIWAVVTLGRSFRTTVEVDADQAVVTRGPYRLVRHPSLLRPPAHRGRIRPVSRQLAGAGHLRGAPRGRAAVAHPGGGSRADPHARRPLPRLPEPDQAPHPRLVVTCRPGP